MVTWKADRVSGGEDAFGRMAFVGARTRPPVILGALLAKVGGRGHRSIAGLSCPCPRA